MASKPMSWQWKLTLAILALIVACFGFLFTASGQAYLMERIDIAYDEVPESERRTSEVADRYMNLAWWRANVLLDDKGAMDMYKEFCGIKTPTIFQTGKITSRYCDERGLTGWGPMHPRAPEAYYLYLEMNQPRASSQSHANECYKYYHLFYNWMKGFSPEHKVHPEFNRYWPKIKNMLAQRPYPPPMEYGVIMSAPEAPPVIDATPVQEKK